MTSQQLKRVWHQLNEQYFHGKLLPIEIHWSNRLTSSAGMFESKTGPRNPQIEPGQRIIKLSTPLLSGLPEQETVGTLAHEMIHQWQFDVLKRCPNHGADFSRKMRELNQDGMGITVYHELDLSGPTHSKFRWQCQRCGQVYHRQRRSIRPRHHQCGSCHGALKAVPSAEPVPHSFPANYEPIPLFIKPDPYKGKPVQLLLNF